MKVNGEFAWGMRDQLIMNYRAHVHHNEGTSVWLIDVFFIVFG